jgi:hypothetical protein
MRCTTAERDRRDAGGVTAEFAVALPAIVIVLAACLGAVQLVSTQVRVQDAASQAARAFGRGETPPARVSGLPGASLGHSSRDGLECATISVPARALGAIELQLEATSCAMGGGL